MIVFSNVVSTIGWFVVYLGVMRLDYWLIFTGEIIKALTYSIINELTNIIIGIIYQSIIKNNYSFLKII